MLFLVACAASGPVENPPVVDVIADPVAVEAALAEVLAEVVQPGDGSTRAWAVELSAGDEVAGLFDDAPRTTVTDELLVWIDDEPGAMWGHDTRLVFYSLAAGTYEVVESDQLPLVNDAPIEGQPVFDDVDELHEGQPMRDGIRQPWQAVPVADRSECCAPPHRVAAVLYNYDKGPLQKDITDNVVNVKAGLEASGFTVSVIYLGDKSLDGLQRLRDFVASHSTDEHCCDEVFVYYSGHGHTKRVDGVDRWYMGLRKGYKGEDGSRSSKKRLYAEDFASILGGLSTCSLNVAIDACYSGGFIDALIAAGAETVRTSASSTEKAWGGVYDGARINGVQVADPYGRAQGETGSEWTSGFAKGLREQAAADKTGRELNDAGYDEALENDIAAIAGKTNPTGATRNEPCDCCAE